MLIPQVISGRRTLSQLPLKFRLSAGWFDRLTTNGLLNPSVRPELVEGPGATSVQV